MAGDTMIAGTFAIRGLLLLITAYLFAAGFLTSVNADDCVVLDFMFDPCLELFKIRKYSLRPGVSRGWVEM